MFRYGGPIKEGVMNGIREPRKTGGSMREAQQWNTVGSPVFPKDSSGRARHLLPAWLAWTGLSAAARAAAPTVMRAVGSAAARRATQEAATKAALTGGGKKIIEKGIPAAATGWKNIFKNWWSGDPAVKGTKWAAKTLTSPTANTMAQKAFKIATSPTTLIGGLWYANGKWFNKKGEEATKEEIKQHHAAGIGAGDGAGDGGPYVPQKSDAELRKERVQRYRDIMDIKGMNKDAAYNSLIEASRVINESEDFKGDIKSGKLINQAIQAASKMYDKPQTTKAAIDTLILKGEIEKDIKAADPSTQLVNELRLKQMKKIDKELAGNTFEEIIQSRMVKGDMPQGNELASLLRLTKNIDVKVIPSTGIKTNQDTLEYVTEVITNFNKDPETGTYPAGVYVIKDRIISVDEQGNVSKVL